MASVQTIADKSPWLLTRKDTMYTGIKAFSAWVDALRKSIFAEYLLKCRSGTSVGASAQRSTPAHPATLVFALNNIFAQELQDDESRPREMNLQEVQDILTSLRSQDLLDLFVGIINGQAKNNTRWFITSSGDLGCGTGSVMSGERLALVVGVAAPMILRPLDPDKQDCFGSRTLAVCSSYVSGWMYGEAFNKEQVRTIHIV